ncbi:MAG: hypothetical protein E3J37_03405 [Anaerolineales bacterium]|nr:MAG: hypothetical protein E3J37_03405 [Anaerolineales bacterium]
MSEIKNVHEAINFVMEKVGYVQKETSKKLSYSFAGESAFIRAIRPHMVEVGLFVYPSSMIDLPAEPFTSRAGNVINITKLAMTYCFHHAPSETKFFVNVIGKGMDSGDKDANKAMTAAFKYALRQTLMIETGDDPDKEGNSKFERGKPIERPLSPEWLKNSLDMKAGGHASDKATVEQLGLAMGMLEACFAGDPASEEKRRSALAYLFEVDSGRDLTNGEILALLDLLKPTKDSGGAYTPDSMAVKEIQAVVTERIKELGQGELPMDEAPKEADTYMKED